MRGFLVSITESALKYLPIVLNNKSRATGKFNFRHGSIEPLRILRFSRPGTVPPSSCAKKIAQAESMFNILLLLGFPLVTVLFSKFRFNMKTKMD